ncbi:MAG: HypC/HybG/HupF family hydrogenase formation chaperone [Bacillota bacterium]|nr:HypC/HybG/HupF family hydrogenase formation chaperone [Bacillota bacterium]MDW7684926.1 HypC/HybG/HupF family hydrogenase formation chaperone [Bacillota bacterium]
MCIGIPCQVVENNGMWGLVEYLGNRRDVSLALVPSAAKGCWVLVHAGLAVQQIDETEAKQTLALLKELDAYE